METITLDLNHYRSTCIGCQFVNLEVWKKKCPYFSHPKYVNISLKCFFRNYLTLEKLMETKKFIDSKGSRSPKAIKKFLREQQLIQQQNKLKIEKEENEVVGDEKQVYNS